MAKQTRSAAAVRNEPQPMATPNRIERVLAFMVAGVFGLSMVAFITMIVAWLTIETIPGTGIWPLVIVLPEVGFPIGMLLVFALLAVTWVRKARENRAETR